MVIVDFIVTYIFLVFFLYHTDGNNSYLEETEQNQRNFRSASPENDFDSLLKMATQNIKRRRDESPEWD